MNNLYINNPLNRKAIKESLQEAYFKQLEADWRALLSAKPDNQTLISIYGRVEIVDLCRKKIRELSFDYAKAKTAYQKVINATRSKHFDAWSEEFCLLFLEHTFGKDITFFKKQIDRLSLLYLTATDRLPKPKNGITDAQIQQAREYPINQLYSGRLRKVGRRFTGLCPFHEERTPSFVIYDNNSFHCFGCQTHGNNAIDFLMKLENIEFKEAIGRFI